MNLTEFVRESNKIEGIKRVLESEITAHEKFLEFEEIHINDLVKFVEDATGAPLRDKPGMNVRVGGHRPPPGGPLIRDRLLILLQEMNNGLITPYEGHVAYETLHPFMDGNGRSGRLLWLWMMQNEYGVDAMDPVYGRGFLHSFYYQALEGAQT